MLCRDSKECIHAGNEGKAEYKATEVGKERTAVNVTFIAVHVRREDEEWKQIEHSIVAGTAGTGPHFGKVGGSADEEEYRGYKRGDRQYCGGDC